MDLDKTVRKKAKKSKKDKKRKECDATNTPEEKGHDDVVENSENIQGENQPLKKKKNSKHKNNNTSLDTGSGIETGHNEQNSFDNSANAEEPDVGKSKKRHKKKKSCNGDGNLDNFSVTSSQEDTNSSSTSSKKKKRSKKENGVVNEISINKSCVNGEDQDSQDACSNDEKAKKKKKKTHDMVEDVDACDEDRGNSLSGKSKQKKPEISENRNNSDENQALNKRSKKKKKKNKEEIVVDTCEELTLKVSSKKKKKDKKWKAEEDNVQDKNGVLSEKEVKKCKKQVGTNVSCEKQVGETDVLSDSRAKTKKTKRKRSTAESHEDDNFSSKKSKTEQSEMSEPDKNLQPSSDQQDTPTKEDKTGSTAVTATEPIMGQWQGDLFNDANRQSKFLRLLGGMKKGPSSSGVAAAPNNKLFKPQGGVQKKGLFGSLVSKSTGGAAMSAAAAVDLNQKLEDDYNKALGLRLSGKKGTGFGFVPDPAEGKKFHIDINKTRSVQFDD